MERQVKLSDISDGKLYELNDCAKLGCNNCEGCCECCNGMGTSIVLDPLDIFNLTIHLKISFQELLAERIELNVVDGIIMPNLKMSGGEDACSFLNDEGRCSIHGYRPGMCRIFPLGRLYENRSFQYFLQVNECRQGSHAKIKVKKWIDTPDIGKNQQFIKDWHYFLKDIQNSVMQLNSDDISKAVTMYILNYFYITPYDLETDFYDQFQERLQNAISWSKKVERK